MSHERDFSLNSACCDFNGLLDNEKQSIGLFLAPLNDSSASALFRKFELSGTVTFSILLVLLNEFLGLMET